MNHFIHIDYEQFVKSVMKQLHIGLCFLTLLYRGLTGIEYHKENMFRRAELYVTEYQYFYFNGVLNKPKIFTNSKRTFSQNLSVKNQRYSDKTSFHPKMTLSIQGS